MVVVGVGVVVVLVIGGVLVVVVEVGVVVLVVVVVGDTSYSMHSPSCKLYQPALQVQSRFELLPTDV